MNGGGTPEEWKPARTRQVDRASAKLALAIIAYNVGRLAWLERRTAPA